MNIKTIHRQLLKKYGKQGWWPLTLPINICGKSKICFTRMPTALVSNGQRFIIGKVRGKPVRFEYGLTYGIAYSRLKDYKTKFRDPYFEIAVGAILTQNTAWKNVAQAIINLYNVKALTPQTILKLPISKLQKLIRPAGYFRQKTKKLRLFSQYLVDNYGGDIRKLKSYKLQVIRYNLLEQWGIGKETADSIILYSLNKPIFVVDEYTRRLCKKYGIAFKEYDEYRNFFEKFFRVSPRMSPRLSAIFREFHALIVEWGKGR